MTTVLETSRLELREMEATDLEFIATMMADAEVMRHYPKPLSRAEVEAWIQRQRERYLKDGHGFWLVVEKATGRPVGQVGLLMQTVDGQRVPEVAYMIHRPFWRRGFATEAALATRDHAFAACGYDRVISLIRPANEPSRGVARKMGMRTAGTALHRGREHVVHAVARGEV